MPLPQQDEFGGSLSEENSYVATVSQCRFRSKMNSEYISNGGYGSLSEESQCRFRSKMNSEGSLNQNPYRETYRLNAASAAR